MKSTSKRVVLAGLLIASIALGWWLFGWSTKDDPTFGVFKYQRYFSRITELYLDSNRDGNYDVRVSFSWRQPYKRNIIKDGYCIGFGIETVEDRNFDGCWDVWHKNLGPTDDGCLYEFNVDTTGDCKPDWKFRTHDTAQAYSDIAARRGF